METHFLVKQFLQDGDTFFVKQFLQDGDTFFVKQFLQDGDTFGKAIPTVIFFWNQ